MTTEELNEFLCLKAAQFEHPDFIENDPISIPHHYKEKEDIEIIALLVATIAWGNRKSIIQSGRKLISLLGESPYDYVMNFKDTKQLEFVHRTFSGNDLKFFILGLQNIYIAGGLELSFKRPLNSQIECAILSFREAMLSVPHEKRAQKHLSNPLMNSACKRLNMFLRWMVRPATKGVDFGLWQSISPSDLHLPLDVHTGNIARKLGILNRSQNDWKSSQILHEYFRAICPEDPAKFDFALFGLGAIEKF